MIRGGTENPFVSRSLAFPQTVDLVFFLHMRGGTDRVWKLVFKW